VAHGLVSITKSRYGKPRMDGKVMSGVEFVTRGAAFQ
jgi:hypothetical protein